MPPSPRSATLLARLREKRVRDEGSDGWELTFADMMTLLLCFFVLLAAISVVDVERYDTVSAALKEGLDARTGLPAKAARETPPSPAPAPALPASSAPASLAELETHLRQAFAGLESVRVVRREDGLAVRLAGPVFFELGSADLTPKAEAWLGTMARTLAETLTLDHTLDVEGHTDDLPIRTAAFPSNWELSAARAGAVLRGLTRQGLALSTPRVVGYADSRPLVPNSSPENRVANRRVVLLIHD